MAYTTNPQLLAAIRQGDEISWKTFQDTYRPLIMLRARDHRLSRQEREELVQSVLIDVFKGSSTFRYDRKQGRFRDYLRKLITNNCIDIIRRRSKTRSVPEEELDSLPSKEQDSQWDEEWRRLLVAQATEILRTKVEPSTFLAYEMYAIKGMSAAKVAKCLDMTKDNVYLAKSRCVEKLQDIIKKLDEE